jgi:diguanylate cyclase (GGDEF)-like protein/PAS domain S-box-containing protein
MDSPTAPVPPLRRISRWLGRFGLRSRMMLLVGGFALPFLIYIGAMTSLQARSDRGDALLHAEVTARVVAARVDDFVDDTDILLRLVARAVAQRDAAGIQPLLDGLRPDLRPYIHNVFVWTPAGERLASLEAGPGRPLVDVVDRGYFQGALRGEAPAIEAPLRAGEAGEQLAVFARAARDSQGNPLAVVAVGTRLRDLQGILDPSRTLADEAVVTLLDPRGAIVARSSDPDEWIGRTVSRAIDPERLRRDTGSAEIVGFDGVSRITGYARATRAGWKVYVGVPVESALTPLRTRLAATLVPGLTALMLGLFVAHVAGSGIARRLGRLASDAARLEAGDLSHRSRVRGRDEVGVLGQALNRMAEGLETRTRDLTRRSTELQLVTDTIPARITYVDANGCVQFGNRHFAAAWGVATPFVGRPLSALVPPVVYEQIAPNLARALAGERLGFALTFDRDGTLQHDEVQYVPDVDAHGAVNGVFTVSQDVTALRRMEAARGESEKRMRLIADNLPAAMAYVNRHERYVFANATFTSVFGIAFEDLVGRRCADVLPSDVYAATRPHIEAVLRGERQRFQRVVARIGSRRHELVEYIPEVAADGEVTGFFALIQDITDLRAAQERVEASEHRLRRITANVPALICYIDRGQRYRFNSRYYEQWLGRPLTEITGRTVLEVMGAASYAVDGPNIERALAGEHVDFEMQHDAGATGTRYLRGSYVPDIDAHGEVAGIYGAITDVTSLKQVEKQLERLARFDALTGLPNRNRFNERMAAALQRMRRTGTGIGLLFLDIDGFKGINDSHGHAAGDAVLRELGRRLGAAVRETDTVARLAGDEFVVVLEGVHQGDECRFVARKILAAMSRPFDTGTREIAVSASIGIALTMDPSVSADALLQRADAALYAAKAQGRNRYEIAS